MLTQHDPLREFERLTAGLFEQSQTPRIMPMDAWRTITTGGGATPAIEAAGHSPEAA